MSTKVQKIMAKQELDRRQLDRAQREQKHIKNMSDDELKKILAEPDEPEKA